MLVIINIILYNISMSGEVNSLPSCAKAEPLAHNLLFAERFPEGLAVAESHLAQPAPHGESCRFNLAWAYWGVGDARGDQVWQHAAEQQEQEVTIHHPASDTHDTFLMHIGRKPDEIQAERLYHQIRLNNVNTSDVAAFFDDSLFAEPQREVYSRTITAWLRLLEGDYDRALEATAAYDFWRHNMLKAVPTVPLVWHSRLATVDMLSYALQGDIQAAYVGRGNLHHPVKDAQDAAKALTQTWQVLPGVGLAYKKRRTVKIGRRLLNQAIAPAAFNAVSQNYFLR